MNIEVLIKRDYLFVENLFTQSNSGKPANESIGSAAMYRASYAEWNISNKKERM